MHNWKLLNNCTFSLETFNSPPLVYLISWMLYLLDAIALLQHSPRFLSSMFSSPKGDGKKASKRAREDVLLNHWPLEI